MAMSWAAAGLTERNFAVVDALRAIAERRGRTLLDLAFSWLLRQPAVSSVIAGATSPEQVRTNAQAGSWQMSAEDLAAIDQITASTTSA